MTDTISQAPPPKNRQAGNEPEAEPQLPPAPPTSQDFRNIGYVLLGLTTIFAINAMETGSYRTPWPIPIVLALLGGGLLVYSTVRKR